MKTAEEICRKTFAKYDPDNYTDIGFSIEYLKICIAAMEEYANQFKQVSIWEELKVKACEFLDSMRAYERESGNSICYDERTSEELWDIHIGKLDADLNPVEQTQPVPSKEVEEDVCEKSLAAIDKFLATMPNDKLLAIYEKVKGKFEGPTVGQYLNINPIHKRYSRWKIKRNIS